MIIPPPPVIMIREPAVVITKTPPQVRLIVETKQGLQGLTGEAGPAGKGAEVTVVADADVQGHRIVGYNNAAMLRHADCTDIDFFSSTLGLTLNAALVGEPLTVATNMEVELPSWNWTMGKAIFLARDGEMTQEPPTSLFLLQVGFPTAPTKMWVEVQVAIEL